MDRRAVWQSYVRDGEVRQNGKASPSLDPKVCLAGAQHMLRDKKLSVQRKAAQIILNRLIPQQYASFLRCLFSVGDWFVTITFRDQHQDSASRLLDVRQNDGRRENGALVCSADPRLAAWEPDSKHKKKPGPPVRDAALREIEHWLIELGWEAAGRTRQEIFDRLADGLTGSERKVFARRICRSCLCCEIYNDPITTSFFYEIRRVATSAIGWVVAEEFGRAGGRWHAHLLIRGVRHLRRKTWWKRAFRRFGRSRIEPVHE